jgi:hypothetical protein
VEAEEHFRIHQAQAEEEVEVLGVQQPVDRVEVVVVPSVERRGVVREAAEDR